MKLNVLALSALILFPLCITAETRTPLHEGWQLQSACKVSAEGAAISSVDFAAGGWLKTSVPSTVLAAQVKAGVLPNPYFGDNLRKIPGATYPVGHNFANLPMSPDSPYACAWWYRKQFNVPALTSKDNRVWLHFGGINYRGELWINGKRIADSSQIAGAYRTYDFDITDAI